MNHFTHKENLLSRYSTAILIKDSAMKKVDIEKAYYGPLREAGLDSDSIITFSLTYNEAGKAPAGFCKEYLDNLLPALKKLGVENLLICDSGYFKVLTKVQKVEPKNGYVVDSKYIEGFNCVVCPNYQQLFYDPTIQNKIDLAVSTLSSFVLGSNEVLGEGIIHSQGYPKTYQEISDALDSLHQYEALTVDIETRSLEFHEAGIETIAFAWDQHNFLAFCVDRDSSKKTSIAIKKVLKKFFIAYKGKVIYHNATYDLQVLVYELWMKKL